MKTASRIVGTAGLLDGFTVQDSPVYGAERRGAPMTAYVRIAKEAIFERGVIPTPDLVVIADDTLLDDPSVQPLSGTGPAAVLLIATTHSANEVRQLTGHPGPIVARDFLALALEETRGPDSPVVDVAYAPPEVGTPSVTASPNTPVRKTGSWRVFRPVIDLPSAPGAGSASSGALRGPSSWTPRRTPT